jgi:hypothetical protein
MTLEDDIRRLSRHMAEHAASEFARKAAALTGGVPVYSDMGGTLVVEPTGEVLLFDHDTGTVKSPGEPKWTLAALAKAAERFPELAALAPVRPPDAGTCPACGGSGLILSIDCGTCMGLGWL